MPIQVEIDQNDLQRIEHRIDAVIHSLDHFARTDMGRVMSDWQIQDMHRHRPFTMRSRHKVQTKVRPHSLREMLGAKRYQAKLAGKRVPRRRHPRAHSSTRPILRIELLTKLYAQMTEKLRDLIHW